MLHINALNEYDIDLQYAALEPIEYIRLICAAHQSNEYDIDLQYARGLSLRECGVSVIAVIGRDGGDCENVRQLSKCCEELKSIKDKICLN